MIRLENVWRKGMAHLRSRISSRADRQAGSGRTSRTGVDLLESQGPRPTNAAGSQSMSLTSPGSSVRRLPMVGQVQKIDLVSQAFKRDPFPTYARWRRIGPVFQVK